MSAPGLESPSVDDLLELDLLWEIDPTALGQVLATGGTGSDAWAAVLQALRTKRRCHPAIAACV